MCFVGRVLFQISIYGNEIPKSLSERGLYGPVKSITYSRFVMLFLLKLHIYPKIDTSRLFRTVDVARIAEHPVV